jgi:hypothetical protein
LIVFIAGIAASFFQLAQVVDIDMQGSGVKQEAEHAVKEQVIEVDAPDDNIYRDVSPSV